MLHIVKTLLFHIGDKIYRTVFQSHVSLVNDVRDLKLKKAPNDLC